MAKKEHRFDKKSFLEQVVGFGILAVFAVLPILYYPGRAASYVTSKQYFLIGIIDLLIIGWTWLLLLDKRYRLTKKNMLVLLPLFLLLLSLTISACAGVDPVTSFFSTVESGTGLILLYHAFVFALIIASYIRVHGKRFVTYILQANLFASVVLAIATFFTGPNGVFDIHSTMLNGSSGGAMMGNVLLAGAYLIFSLFLTVYLFLHESKTWRKALYIAGIAVIILSPVYFKLHSIVGNARIATAALVVGVFASLFIALSLSKDNKLRRTIGITGIVAMIVVGGIGLQQIISPTSSAHAFFVRESGNRIIDWHAAIDGIEQRPVLGWGQENFHVLYQKYFNPIVLDPLHGSEAWALHPHNNSLEVLVNGGIIAFLLYLFMVVSLFIDIRNLYRKNVIDRKTFALFIGMLIAFILQQQMVYDSIVSYVMFFFIIALVSGWSDQNTESRHVYATTSATTVGILVTAVMIPLWIYAAYLPAQKMDEFQTVASAHSDARIAAYHHLFYSPGSYAIDTDMEFYTSPIFYSYQLDEVMIRSNPQYQKIATQEIGTLIAQITPLWINRPYDYHLTLSLVQLENLQFYFNNDPADLKSADLYAARAFPLAPNDPQIYFAHAQTLVYEKNVPGAIAALNQALALYPQYQPALKFKKDLQS